MNLNGLPGVHVDNFGTSNSSAITFTCFSGFHGHRPRSERHHVCVCRWFDSVGVIIVKPPAYSKKVSKWNSIIYFHFIFICDIMCKTKQTCTQTTRKTFNWNYCLVIVSLCNKWIIYCEKHAVFTWRLFLQGSAVERIRDLWRRHTVSFLCLILINTRKPVVVILTIFTYISQKTWLN